MTAGIAIGRIVWYRSKTGVYSCPGIITATTDTLHMPNVEAGHIEALSSPSHVHLSVFTPGKPGEVSEETARTHPELLTKPPTFGIYQEFDVPFWEFGKDPLRTTQTGEICSPGDASIQPAGTWTWPVRL